MSLTVTVDDGIAVLALDDGERNALDPERFAQLSQAFDDAGDDVEGFVITGRPGILTAGLDLKFMQSAGPDGIADLLTRFGATLMQVWTEPRPTVCAATGHALAAGTMIAMACDHAVAAEGEFFWGLMETQINFTMPEFGITLARHNMRADRVDDLLLPGRRIDAAHAVEAGYADELAPPDDVFERAMAHARTLAALPSPAYAATKQRLRGDAARRVLAGLDEDIASMSSFFGD